MNVITKANKQALIDMIGKPVFINHFNQAEWSYSLPAGQYFIDSVIFHFNGSIELGVSEYDPDISTDQFDIDKSHISYFNFDDLQIIDHDQGTHTTLFDPKAA